MNDPFQELSDHDFLHIFDNIDH